MDRQFTIERIAKTKEVIVAYEDAITALAADSDVLSYTLDTSQSRQTVTRVDIPRMQTMLDSLYNRLATLEARVYGASTQARPGW